MITKKIKALITAITFGFAVAGVGMVAHAGPAKPEKSRAAKMDKADSWEAKREKQIAELRDSLQLTEQQEVAWKEYCTAVKAAKEKLKPVKEEYRQKWAKMSEKERAEKKAQKAQKAEQWANMTAIERLEKKQAKMPEGAEAIGEILEATRVFYAQLTPEQQKTFDAGMLAISTKK